MSHSFVQIPVVDSTALTTAAAVGMADTAVMTPTGTVAPTGVTIAATTVGTVMTAVGTIAATTAATTDLARGDTVMSVPTIAESAMMDMVVWIDMAAAVMTVIATGPAVAMTAVPPATIATGMIVRPTVKVADPVTRQPPHPAMVTRLPPVARLGTTRSTNFPSNRLR